MTSATLKQKIHQYLDTSDDKMLKIVYSILDEHAKIKNQTSLLNQNQKSELDKRMKLYEAGKMEVYDWSEVYKELKIKK